MLIGEAYVNFGFFGAMAFLYLFYLIRLIDWRCRIDGKFDGLIDYRRLCTLSNGFFVLHIKRRFDVVVGLFYKRDFVYYAVRYVMDRARA